MSTEWGILHPNREVTSRWDSGDMLTREWAERLVLDFDNNGCSCGQLGHSLVFRSSGWSVVPKSDWAVTAEHVHPATTPCNVMCPGHPNTVKR